MPRWRLLAGCCACSPSTLGRFPAVTSRDGSTDNPLTSAWSYATPRNGAPQKVRQSVLACKSGGLTWPASAASRSSNFMRGCRAGPSLGGLNPKGRAISLWAVADAIRRNLMSCIRRKQIPALRASSCNNSFNLRFSTAFRRKPSCSQSPSPASQDPVKDAIGANHSGSGKHHQPNIGTLH